MRIALFLANVAVTDLAESMFKIHTFHSLRVHPCQETNVAPVTGVAIRDSKVFNGYSFVQLVFPPPQLISPYEEVTVPPSSGDTCVVSVFFLSANVAVIPFALLTTKEQVFPTMVVQPPVHPVKVESGPVIAVKLNVVPTGKDALKGSPPCNVSTQRSEDINTSSRFEIPLSTTCTFLIPLSGVPPGPTG